MKEHRRHIRRVLNISLVLILMLISFSISAGVFDAMEKALMPGELSKAHEEFISDCKVCHKFFRQSQQNVLCLDCHDHKNIAKDIKRKKGFHGRIPGVKKKECKTCHREHIGRNADIILLDKQTFNHSRTDFVLRGSHLEVQCHRCHKPKKKYYQAKHKCVDCHKDDEPHKGKLGKVCNSCHRETAWSDFQFDHSKTDFALRGKHKGVACRDCHPQERYLEIPKTCFACHKNDDNHKRRFSKKCKKCHTPIAWPNIKFKHNKDTKFKLTGKHKQVACNQCHKKGKNAYKEKRKKNCYACHRYSDEHKGLYGKKCEKCHNTKAWGKSRFNHDKTDFPLRGKHKKVICNDCHPGDLYKQELSTKCYACHKQHDVHDSQQGKKCNECHNEKGWLKNVRFDHDLVDFPLLGSHSALACEECHQSNVFKDASPKCVSCHVDDDEHKKQLGPTCGYCHVSNDWKVWQFNHNKQTEFKLKGAHKGIDCLECHTEEVEDEFDMPSTCYGCHADDDRHDGGFGRVCSRCHNETSFEEVAFQ